MKRLAGLLLPPMFLLAAGGAPVLAAGPGSWAHIDRFSHVVLVDANYVAPQSCWRVASTRRGAPAGANAGGDIPVTMTMTRSGSCAPAQKLLRGGTNVGFQQMGAVVRIFFVGPDGKVVKTERVAIESEQ